MRRTGAVGQTINDSLLLPWDREAAGSLLTSSLGLSMQWSEYSRLEPKPVTSLYPTCFYVSLFQPVQTTVVSKQWSILLYWSV